MLTAGREAGIGKTLRPGPRAMAPGYSPTRFMKLGVSSRAQLAAGVPRQPGCG